MRFAKVGDGHSICVLQTSGGSRFTTKPGARCFVFDKTLVQYLNCDRPVNQHMTRAIDCAHATDAQSRLKMIFVVKRTPHQRIDRNRLGDGDVSLQSRPVLRTNLQIGRVMPSAYRAMKHMKTRTEEN